MPDRKAPRSSRSSHFLKVPSRTQTPTPQLSLSRHSQTTARSARTVFLVLLLPALLTAQEPLAGIWRGELTTPVGALAIVITLDGDHGGSVAVPSRGVSGIPVTEVSLADGTVAFMIPADSAAFEGRLVSPTSLAGVWIQAGQRIPFELKRVGDVGEAPPEVVRPQTPRPPFPYRSDEVVVRAEVELACTLTRPASAAPATEVPGAVLLTVAGPNDRDQTHSGHKPYQVLADHLARRGVAVLRCDDRGVGGSSGELTRSTIDDLASDALAMMRFLAALDKIGPVGAIGNSEGSVVAALAAAREPESVSFVVLLGGVGVRGAEVIRARLIAQAMTQGRTDDEADALAAPFDRLVEAVTEAGGVGIAALRASRPQLVERLTEIAREAGDRDPFLPTDLDQRVALFAGPWYHAQLTLDGGKILTRVRVPVLALTGSKDRTNLPEQNLPAIRRALEQAGNQQVVVREIPDLNHLFQTAVIGGMAEYAQLEESFAPTALSLISDWILARFVAAE